MPDAFKLSEYDRLQRQAMFECIVLASQKDDFMHEHNDHYTQTKASEKQGMDKINDYLYKVKRIQTPTIITANGQRNEKINFHNRALKRELYNKFKVNQQMGRAKSACQNDR